MTDIFSKRKRSQIMSRVKSKNTETEKIVFRYLRKNNVYFQAHYKKAPGKPDIALPRRKKAVFIDSDFWHGRDMSKVTDNEFWKTKISRNKERDSEVNEQLSDLGWDVMRIWESDLRRKSTQSLELKKIMKFLTEA